MLLSTCRIKVWQCGNDETKAVIEAFCMSAALVYVSSCKARWASHWKIGRSTR